MAGSITVTASDSPYSVTCTIPVILVDSSAGAIELRLPSSNSAQNRSVRIIKISNDSNLITITPFGSDVIDQDTSFTFTNKLAYTLSSFGSGNWALFNGNPKSIVDVKEFGATGNGSTDDTTAIQAAVTNCINNTLYFPPGTYKISSEISIINSIKIIGQGTFSIIQASVNTQNIFSIATDSPVIIEDLTFTTSVTKTAGAAIIVNGATSSYNLLSHFNRLYFYSQYYDIFTQNAASWWITDCYFNSTVNAAIYVSNENAPDLGDSVIRGNQFFSAAGQVAIRQASSGGLKILENTIVAYGYAFFMNIAVGVTTECLDISHNHFANQTNSNIGILNSSTTGIFNFVKIQDNQLFSGGGPNLVIAGSLVSNVTINNNTIVPDTGQYGIYLDNVSLGIVEGNSFFGDTTNLAINIQSNVVKLNFGFNHLGNTAGISNSSTTSAVNIPLNLLLSHTTNASAASAGLAVGSFYRTGLNPDTICVVH